MLRDTEGGRYELDRYGYAVDEAGERLWRVCDCIEQKRIRRLFRSSRITEAFQRISFDGYQTDGEPGCMGQALAAAKHYVAHFSELRHRRQNSITLLGESGSGKTTLLAAVANALIQQSVHVVYFPWVDGSKELHEASRSDGDSVVQRLDALKKCDLLFIDDLFKGDTQPTPFQVKNIFEIVNYRYLECKPIMVCSELDFSSMMDLHDHRQLDSPVSRIVEMSQDYTVRMALTAEEEKRDMKLNYRLRKRGASA